MPSSPPALSRAQILRIRDLSRDKRARKADGTFVLEGAKAVQDVLSDHPRLVSLVVITQSYLDREPLPERRLRERAALRSFSCQDRTFASLSGLDTPQGILAVVRQPVWDQEQVLTGPSLLGLYGEQLQDPLNVGAIIRTAAALNVTAVWLSPDSADRYNPKVVRAAGGALLSLPDFFADDAEALARRDCVIYAAEAPGSGAVDMHEISRVPARLVLAVGNEGKGLSEKTRKLAARRFTIPLSRNVESLNVAATVAIATHYFGRLPQE